MLIKYPVVSWMGRGDVYEINNLNQFTKQNDGGLWVIVQHDDLLQLHRPLVLCCPISGAKGNTPLEGEDEIGKVQYIYNGKVYIIHCDEVGVKNRKAFDVKNRKFHLSESLMDNVTVEISRMLNPGSALDLEYNEIADPDSVGNIDPTAVQPSKIYVAPKEPIVVITTKKDNICNDSKKESSNIAVNDNVFITKWITLSSAEKKTYALSLGSSYYECSRRAVKIQMADYKHWPEEKTIEFMLDYEQYESKKLKSNQLLDKYNLSSTKVAKNIYSNLIGDK